MNSEIIIEGVDLASSRRNYEGYTAKEQSNI